MTTPLADALEASWHRFGGRDGLLPQLAVDAIAARIGGGEPTATSAARLLEILVRGEGLANEPRWVPAVLLRDAAWQEWPSTERETVRAVLDAWWAETLAFDPPPDAPDHAEVVLGCLVHTGVPLIRWLEPWLADLDGSPARHLAALAAGGLDHEVWDDHPDERGQIQAWLRSEPVVMGITIVGGIHLDDGVLAAVLEQILE